MVSQSVYKMHTRSSPTHFWIIFCQGQQQKKLENGEFVTLEDLIISIVCKNVFVVRTMHNGTIRFQYWPYFEIRFAILDLLTQHSLWACRQSAKYFNFKTKCKDLKDVHKVRWLIFGLVLPILHDDLFHIITTLLTHTVAFYQAILYAQNQ